MAAVQASCSQFLQNFILSMQALKLSVENIKEVQILESSKAAECAEKVYQLTKEYKDLILSSPEGIETLLQKDEIPFPLVNKLMQMLSSEELQFCDELKASLSKTTSIYIQLIVFQCAAQDRRVYKETVTQLSNRVDIILSTLPEQEIEAQFDLECSKAAIQNLDPGRGRWKEVGADHAMPLLKATLKAIFSRNPGELIGPIVDLTARVYQELAIGSCWYQRVWPISWGQSIHTFEEFGKLQSYISEQKGKSRLYIPLSRAMREILQDEKISLDLKKHVLFNEALSVSTLADKYPTRFQKLKWRLNDKFWKTRCLSVTTLGMVVRANSPYKDQAARKIVACIFDETGRVRESDKRVSDHIQKTLESFWGEHPIPVEKEKVEEVALIHQKQLEGSQKELAKEAEEEVLLEQQLAENFKEKEGLQKQLDAGFPQSSKGEEVKKAVMKGLLDKERIEKELKSKKEELFLLKEEKTFEIKDLQVQQQNLQFLQKLLEKGA